MTYIVHRRFRGKTLSGEVNLPAQTVCTCEGGVIRYEGKNLCYRRSENAHQYFAVNDDGCGMKRGQLTHAIQKILERRDAQYQERWDRVWDDPLCQKYKREDYDDMWFWNTAFFEAPILDLRHIASLVGAKED
jgi:hypothetical protein